MSICSDAVVTVCVSTNVMAHPLPKSYAAIAHSGTPGFDISLVMLHWSRKFNPDHEDWVTMRRTGDR
ncbi:hypothetical protein H6F74_26730 [Trichocoleus sp. FACHB-90]|uniref:hypothetical protein n=1 Tax=Trichocoleus sp. FACHB-90 TaxID=2692876 RepID=UPI00168835CC|nr:hypothetical protein [Trichocoleus sp. FACHB-90]MBD1929802.1 hypothetical protein [Trichocoleus sp. FACHB-90]